MDVVIGIGNPLRRDDGIGPRVAQALRASSSVFVCAVQELVPELVLCLRDSRRVLFVDAEVNGAEVRISRVKKGAAGWGHDLGPRGLLKVVAQAFGSAPEAFSLSVPGFDFGYGEGLSGRAAAFLPQAIDEASQWLQGT